MDPQKDGHFSCHVKCFHVTFWLQNSTFIISTVHITIVLQNKINNHLFKIQSKKETIMILLFSTSFVQLVLNS